MPAMERFLFGGVGLTRVWEYISSTFDQKRGLKPVRYWIKREK